MAKVTTELFMSLDGVIAREGMIQIARVPYQTRLRGLRDATMLSHQN